MTEQPVNSISGTKFSKTSTPTSVSVPPGLSSSQDFPPLAAPQPVAPPKLQRKVAGTSIGSNMIKPVVPVLPGQQPRAPALSKETRVTRIVEQPDDADTTASSADPENAIEASATKYGGRAKPKTKQSLVGSSRKAKIAPSDNFNTKALTSQQPKPLPIATADPSQKAAEKRPHPGKLDITAAEDASKEDMESVASSSAQSKSIDPVSTLSTISRPPTPETEASQVSLSSAPRQIQPRTIRVLSTPKVETPPRLNPASPLMANAATCAAASKQLSRRASLSSIHPPGTPASEKISDNASFTSTSMSRANSPPPSKVGSAPIRQYTKSQQRKERQVRAKLAEENFKKEGSSAKAIAEEPVQAPIIGRKKKTKKATRDTSDSTPVATRPSSPTLKEETFQNRTTSRPETPVKDYRKGFLFLRDNKEPATPASPVASSSGDHHQRNLLPAGSIFSSLQKSGDVSPSVLDLFKGVPGLNYRFELTHNDLAEKSIPTLSEAHCRQIEKGEPIVLDMPNNKRVVFLPDRSTLRGLNDEEAQRYLILRKKILSTTGAAKFHPPGCDMDCYLHAGSRATSQAQSKAIRGYSSSTDEFLDLRNRFEERAPTPEPPPLTLPPHWISAPLTNESMVKRLRVELEGAEDAMLLSRKETEGMEKKLNGLLKRNRRLLFGSSQ